MEEGLYIAQHCEKCAHDWNNKFMDLSEFFLKMREKKEKEIGDKIVDAMQSINIMCPECESKNTKWTVACWVDSANHSSEEVDLLKEFIQAVSKVAPRNIAAHIRGRQGGRKHLGHPLWRIPSTHKDK